MLVGKEQEHIYYDVSTVYDEDAVVTNQQPHLMVSRVGVCRSRGGGKFPSDHPANDNLARIGERDDDAEGNDGKRHVISKKRTKTKIS